MCDPTHPGSQRRALLATFAAASLAVVSVSGSTSGAEAQGRETAAAANAYDRGMQEALTENWEAAAEWFETANRLSPAAPALVRAIQARQEAGQHRRAASLALQLHDDYPDQPDAQEMAEALITPAREQYFLVQVECDSACAVELDGSVAAHSSLFLEPGAEYTVAGLFTHGRREARVSGEAGETRVLHFEAPPPPRAELRAGASRGREPFRFGKPVFISAAALTGAALAATLGLGVSTQRQGSAWNADVRGCADGTRFGAACDEANQRDRLERGNRRETATNAMIGVTAGLAALTVVTAIWTNWGETDADTGAGTPDVSAAVGLGPGGGMLVLEGGF